METPAFSANDIPGLPARVLAADILESILLRTRPLDEELKAKSAALSALEERDRALTRHLIATVLRKLGTLRHLLTLYLESGLPPDAPRVESALLLGAAQILYLQVPDHAAVDLSVRLVQADRRDARYAKMVNAILRRVGREGAAALANFDSVTADTPAWLLARWTKNYGADKARAIASANGQEAALDLSVKVNPHDWAEKLGGRVLPNGSVRIAAGGMVTALAGYDEGAWWVQDAAASLPAKLFGDVRGLRVADLCAAPGGKTLQLANAGARVTAIDRSSPRLARLRENLSRLGLSAEIVVADATKWQPAEPFDAILVDAPCLATGTIRRHPDLPWLKREPDLAGLASLQSRLLDRAASILKPGGTLVYCTCSLEPEEGEDAIARLLKRHPAMKRVQVTAQDIPGCAEFLTPLGDIRTLPCQWPDPDPRMSGLDGFFAARLKAG